MDFTHIVGFLKEKWAALTQHMLYTPSEEELRTQVKDFLAHEPGWLSHAISLDPALLDKGEEGALAELLTYQGLHAIALHRQAHALYEKGEFAEARRISQGARRVTGGIEIHPGARIGKNFFIDHGAGVVIGETARIGDDVFLYHTVTLGATGRKDDVVTEEDGVERRHPKLKNHIKVGNGAQILGPAVIGDWARIGTGAKLVGHITVADGKKGASVRINDDVHIKGSVSIGAGVTIASDALLKCDENSKIIIGDNVVIGEGARILGGVTIGKGAQIRPGVEVQEDVPAGAIVVGKVPALPGFYKDDRSKCIIIEQPKPDNDNFEQLSETSNRWQNYILEGYGEIEKRAGAGAGRV